MDGNVARIFEDRVALERLRMEAHRRLGPSLVESMKVRVSDAGLDDFIRGQLLIALEAEVLAQRLADREYHDTVEVDCSYPWPASWWQHMKIGPHDSPLWRWIERHRPPQMRVITQRKTVTMTVKVTDYAKYPHANILFPDDRLGAPVLYQQVNRWTDVDEAR
jgi:hypothetical protein